jgi:hypothetical protein
MIWTAAYFKGQLHLRSPVSTRAYPDAEASVQCFLVSFAAASINNPASYECGRVPRS